MGRDATWLRPLAKELGDRATVVEGDVARPDEAGRIVGAAVAARGGPDILVNNAGGATVGGLLDLDDAAWQRDLDLKLFGYVRLMRAGWWPGRQRRAAGAHQGDSG